MEQNGIIKLLFYGPDSANLLSSISALCDNDPEKIAVAEEAAYERKEYLGFKIWTGCRVFLIKIPSLPQLELISLDSSVKELLAPRFFGLLSTVDFAGLVFVPGTKSSELNRSAFETIKTIDSHLASEKKDLLSSRPLFVQIIEQDSEESLREEINRSLEFLQKLDPVPEIDWAHSPNSTKLHDQYINVIQLESARKIIDYFIKPESSSESKSNEERQPAQQPEPPPIVSALDSQLGNPAPYSDQPHEEDLLGRETLVTGLAAMFVNRSQYTPMTVGLFGLWGEGKSTILQLVKKAVLAREQPRFDFVMFNAWEYEKTPNLAAGLAREVVRGLTEGLDFFELWALRISFAMEEQGSDLFWRVAKVLACFILALGGLLVLALVPDLPVLQKILGTGASVGALAGFLSLWKQLQSSLEHPLSTKIQSYLKLPEYGEHLGLIPVLKRQVQLLRELRGIGDKAHQRRLVIYVDDLDRCGPEAIVKTFEAIRLVLDLPGAFIVLAIDQRIAMNAIKGHFKDFKSHGLRPEQIARDYIGKIIQVPIQLEPPDKPERDKFIRRFLFPDARPQDAPSSESKDDTSTNETEKKGAGSPPPEQGTDTGEDSVARSETDMNEPAEQDTSEEDQPSESGEGSSQKKGPDEPLDGKKEELGAADTGQGTNDADQNASPRAKEPEKAPRQSPQLDQLLLAMEETEAEVEVFIKLVDIIRLRNPRQLLRLRNSYRLLKLLQHQELIKDESDESRQLNWQQLMRMLFWQEYLHSLTFETHQRIKSRVWASGSDEDAQVEDKKHLDHWRELNSDHVSKNDYERVRELVNVVILPRSEPMPGEKDSEENTA